MYLELKTLDKGTTQVKGTFENIGSAQTCDIKLLEKKSLIIVLVPLSWVFNSKYLTFYFPSRPSPQRYIRDTKGI